MDFLISLGVKEVDIFLHHLPHKIEEKLEDGRCWGIKCTFHLVKDEKYPFASILPVVSGWPKQNILLGCSDRLPKFESSSISMQKIKVPHLIVYPSKKWTGWGCIPLNAFKKISKKSEYEDIPEIFSHNYKAIIGKKYLSVESLLALKRTNLKAISNELEGIYFPTGVKCIQPDVWVSRGVSIHPTVKIIPPVFIGENSVIHEGVTLGPKTLIKKKCVVDARSEISNSIVCKNTYVGEGLCVKDSIVDKNLLINTTLGTEIKVSDDFILSGTRSPPLRIVIQNLIERLFATGIFVVILPIFIGCFSIFGIKKTKVLKISGVRNRADTFDLLSFNGSTVSNKSTLKNALLRIPELINIIKGEMHFVGLPSRTVDEVEALSEEWRQIYLSSKVGVITLVDLEQGSEISPHEQLISELFYVANESSSFDFKVMSSWIMYRIKKSFHR